MIVNFFYFPSMNGQFKSMIDFSSSINMRPDLPALNWFFHADQKIWSFLNELRTQYHPSNAFRVLIVDKYGLSSFSFNIFEWTKCIERLIWFFCKYIMMTFSCFQNWFIRDSCVEGLILIHFSHPHFKISVFYYGICTLEAFRTVLSLRNLGTDVWKCWNNFIHRSIFWSSFCMSFCESKV